MGTRMTEKEFRRLWASMVPLYDLHYATWQWTRLYGPLR
jgi:hypothetical protein